MTLKQIDQWLEATKTQKDYEYDQAIHSKQIQDLMIEFDEEE